MSDEIELKLALAPQAPAQIAEHPLLRSLESRTTPLGNQYYDTPEGALQANRVALRVRRLGERRVQTLKSAAQSQGGLSTRGEWEWPIDDVERNAAGLDVKGLHELAHPALAAIDLERLAPVFATDFERRTWRYRQGDSDIEIALDQGEIIVGETRLPICELELELKQGQPEQLWMLAEALCGTASSASNEETVALPARPANHSKASRAGHLRSGWPAPPPTATITLDALIDAIDTWQDSGDSAWQRHAEQLAQRLAAQVASDHRPALTRIAEALARQACPWNSQDWLALRRALA
ncbi:CYTH domain-containing protein [Salinicola avicenniae]|uniref:CYTH domain-containing protein n=1 Tax=Salinicola avicenniae TaxID=2916836 RepID=UPI002072DE19|nr:MULTISPECIES: CYTH domain-containing protein [unclassified Salinicola]